MKLSDKRKGDLYSAIREPLVDERLFIARSCLSESNKVQLDRRLFNLEQKIWREVKAALNLEEVE